MVIGAGVDRHRVAHHPGRHRVWQADVDRAHGPGVAEVVGGDRQLVAAELFRHPPAHLLQGGAAQVGSHRGQGGLERAQLLQAEVLHPLRLEGPHLVFPGFAGGENPDHPVTARGQGREVGEEDLVVAQAVGGHQAVGQAPAGIGDLVDQGQDLLIARQAAELGCVQSVASRPDGPVLRQLQPVMAGQGSQGGAALLTTAAGGGVALEHPLQQRQFQGQTLFGGDRQQPPQVGPVGTAPGGAAAGGVATAAGIAKKSGLKALQAQGIPAGWDRFCWGQAPPLGPVKTPLSLLAQHLLEAFLGPLQSRAIGMEAEADSLHPVAPRPHATGQGPAQP